MKALLRLFSVMFLLLLSVSATSAIDAWEFDNDVDRERFQRLSKELRCPKCQNQSIADSDAPVAQDLRKVLYQQIKSGNDDQIIIDGMVERYGEFVRYRPSLFSAGGVIWLVAFCVFLLAMIVAVFHIRSRQRSSATSPVAVDNERLNALLNEDISVQAGQGQEKEST